MADNKSTLGTLEDTLDLYLVKKAPALPSNIKELLVKLAPWFTLIFLILSLPVVLVALGLGAIIAPFAPLAGPIIGMNYGMTYTISVIVLATALVLEAMAIPGLFKRSAQGWRYVYWATLVGVVSNLISFNIVGGVISALIGLYLLFQIKSYYH